MGVENGMFRSEIGSGFKDPGGTPPPRIPRSSEFLEPESARKVKLQTRSPTNYLHVL